MICLSCDPERLLWSSSTAGSSVTVRHSTAGLCGVLSIGCSRVRKTSARPHNGIMRDSFRIERDTMGDMQVPVSALYWPQTARAVQNFLISGKRFPRSFIRAMGMIKSAAATMNGRMGHLAPTVAASIEAAAEQVVEGRYDDEFPIDIFQTGSGTSTNMNANEVIGHLADAHPNDHVNLGQSSNDVIPTAMHIAVAECLVAQLLPAMRQLGASLERKAAEFHDIIKIGRTHLQDAVPIRLGQEFSGYARQVEAARERIESALASISTGNSAVRVARNFPAEAASFVLPG